MTSEKNGRQIAKAFLKNQGNSNEYAAFDPDDTVSQMEITFLAPLNTLTTFTAQFYANEPNVNVVLEYFDGTNTDQEV